MVVSFVDFLLLLLTQSVWHLVLVLLRTNSGREGARSVALNPNDNKKVKIVEREAGTVREEPRL